MTSIVVQSAPMGRGSSVVIPAIDLSVSAVLERHDHDLRYLGPTLRGVFGVVLKDVVCQMAHRDCARCELAGQCAFPAIFDGRAPQDRALLRRYPTIPQPFILDVAEPGSWRGSPRELLFGIRLMGEARELWPTIVDALLLAGRRGVGPHRVRFRIAGVQDGRSGALVWHNDAPGSRTAQTWEIAAGESLRSERVRLIFETPLSLREDGRRALEPSPLSILLAAKRRVRILQGFYGQESSVSAPHRAVAAGSDTTASDQGSAVERDGLCTAVADGGNLEDMPHFAESAFRVTGGSIERWAIERYSGRQQRRVPLAGIVGHMDIEGPWPLVGGWFRMIEHTHLGKHTSFGLGRVRIEELFDDDVVHQRGQNGAGE